MSQPPLSRAVQERHAPKIVEADDAQRARWRNLDYFASPPWSSRAGAELIRKLDQNARVVWEPACGDGIMAKCLAETFDEVIATDIYTQGFGQPRDFLAELSADHNPICDWVVTNPPFGHAEKFIRVGFARARRGVAVLCRLALLESRSRYDALFQKPGLTVLAPFVERVPMQLGPWNPTCSTATAYAWFIFMRGKPFGEHPIVMPFPPGTRDRLSRKDDIRRFVTGS